MKKHLKNITVLYNLPVGNDPDDMDTGESASGVADGLDLAGYTTQLTGITAGDISQVGQIKADLVFNLVEWAGRDYVLAVEAIKQLEQADLPYTGSNPWGYALSCDKILMKKLLDKYHIPTPKWQVFTNSKFKISNLKFPLIAKVVHEHAAVGISQASVVENEADLRHLVSELLHRFRQPVLVEEFINGDEAQITVLEKHGQPWVLPPAIFRYQKKAGYWPINTYEAKWGTGWESRMSDWTEDIDPKLVAQMQSLAKKCYLQLGGRSYPRMDMRIHSGKVYVLEVNNNPGIDFDPESGIAVAAKAAGLDWPGLLTNIVQEAYLMHQQNSYDPAIL